MYIKNLCRGCFSELRNMEMRCPYCGFDRRAYERDRRPEVLPVNTILHGTYLLGKCIGKGGFGITYIGWHINLEKTVAIKEFYPAGVVFRDMKSEQDQNTISIRLTDSAYRDEYQKSIQGFLKEARTLAKIDLPGVVTVHDCFEENGTVYLVMDYIRGRNLKEYIQSKGGKISEKDALTLMHPVLTSLQKLHLEGVIHRDISPDNILLNEKGQVILIDFGSARSIGLQNSGGHSMTVILKPGYAPIEQYNSRGNQGPWTDVYALCATLYKMMTGLTPEDPFIRADDSRSKDKLYENLKNNGVSNETSQALIKGMELLAVSRYQNVGELENDLYRVIESAEVSSTGQEITKFDDQRVPECIPDISTDEETELLVKEKVTERLITHGSAGTEIPSKYQQMHAQLVNPGDAAAKSGTRNNKKAGKNNRHVLRLAIPIIALICLFIAGLSWANSSLSVTGQDSEQQESNASQVKEDIIIGKMNVFRYSNEYLGLSIKLPTDWSYEKGTEKELKNAIEKEEWYKDFSCYTDGRAIGVWFLDYGGVVTEKDIDEETNSNSQKVLLQLYKDDTDMPTTDLAVAREKIAIAGREYTAMVVTGNSQYQGEEHRFKDVYCYAGVDHYLVNIVLLSANGDYTDELIEMCSAIQDPALEQQTEQDDQEEAQQPKAESFVLANYFGRTKDEILRYDRLTDISRFVAVYADDNVKVNEVCEQFPAWGTEVDPARDIVSFYYSKGNLTNDQEYRIEADCKEIQLKKGERTTITVNMLAPNGYDEGYVEAIAQNGLSYFYDYDWDGDSISFDVECFDDRYKSGMIQICFLETKESAPKEGSYCNVYYTIE